MNIVSITPVTERANQARKDEAEFRHKTVHILTEWGWTTCAIAELLKVTQRRVQTLLHQPCGALETERREKRDREARERLARASGALFFNEAFPETEPPLQLDPSLSTREKVERYLRERKVSQAEVARRLGISRQAVWKHVQALTVQRK